MGSSAGRPVARRWVLEDSAFGTPERARRFRDTGFPVLAEHEGYLGDFLLLDPERAELGGLSLWADEESERRSRAYLTEAASAHLGPEAARQIAVTTFGVRFSLFNLGPGGHPVVPSRESVVGWSVTFRGESMLDPAVQDVLVMHADEYVVRSPARSGC